jgi:hypothetical protein
MKMTKKIRLNWMKKNLQNWSLTKMRKNCSRWNWMKMTMKKMIRWKRKKKNWTNN